MSLYYSIIWRFCGQIGSENLLAACQRLGKTPYKIANL